MKYKVSIIIPIYNVETYISKCAKSILDQTLTDVEFIFIDDCSVDDSVNKLQEVLISYPALKSNIKLLHNSKNMGLPSARNIGIKHANGEYIIFSDSDDWIERDALFDLYTYAKTNFCDIVYCDYYETYRNHDSYISQDYGTNKINCIKKMFEGKLHCSTCFKLIKKSLYENNHIKFVDGADMFEDVGTTIRLMASASKIGYIPKAYYHYVQYNTGSIIQTMSHPLKKRIRTLQKIKNIQVACNFLDKQDILEYVRAASNEMKLLAKNDLLENNTYSLCRWIVTFPESDSAIWKSDNLSLNLKFLLTWLHCRCLWLYKFQKWITKQVKR